eukprot:Protomagalhaensia_wolfi_Nauph_80__969@NODE_1560_length_1468_cov_1175_213436_g510_i1_p2_GENE_NODE_1560_length_1468_cov_1175_213436_g510_i1NODE_1560_length_1468_cov_1175_213436_g510_i1_p2_ORF_typecomplete_len161_score30_01_NODE_1560_length_1468_cov_1175_213436_g510_i19381420
MVGIKSLISWLAVVALLGGGEELVELADIETDTTFSTDVSGCVSASWLLCDILTGSLSTVKMTAFMHCLKSTSCEVVGRFTQTATLPSTITSPMHLPDSVLANAQSSLSTINGSIAVSHTVNPPTCDAVVGYSTTGTDCGALMPPIPVEAMGKLWKTLRR